MIQVCTKIYLYKSKYPIEMCITLQMKFEPSGCLSLGWPSRSSELRDALGRDSLVFLALGSA